MRKRACSLLTIIILLSILSGCKKDDDNDNDNNNTTPITVLQVQESFVADITATWCLQCGAWMSYYTRAFDGYGGIDGSRLNGIAAHGSSSSQDNLYCSAAGDFKTFFNVSSWPSYTEGIVRYDGFDTGEITAWENAIKTTQAKTPSCAVGISKSISGNTMTIKTRTKFYASVNDDAMLAVYITEDDVVEPQKKDLSGDYDSTFVHDRVLRGAATPTWGVKLVTGAKNGNEFNKDFSFTINSAYNKSNLHVVAVIYRNDCCGKLVEVLNSHSE